MAVLCRPLSGILPALRVCLPCLQVYKALRHGAQPVAVKVLSVSACLPAAHLPARPPARLPACPPARLPACLPVCFLKKHTRLEPTA